MSGVFEQALARIEAMEKFLHQHGPAIMAIAQQMAGAGQQQVQQQSAAQSFGLSTPVQQAQANFSLGASVQQAQPTVTPDMVQQLIMPLLANDQAKQLLQQHMQAMGIPELAQTRADQLSELYQRFQQVAAQFGGGGQQVGGGGQQVAQVQQAAAPSII